MVLQLCGVDPSSTSPLTGHGMPSIGHGMPCPYYGNSSGAKDLREGIVTAPPKFGSSPPMDEMARTAYYAKDFCRFDL